MMKRKEFQQWLDQFPEDTIIEVMVQEESGSWESYGACYATVFEAVEFDHYEYTNFTGNPLITPDRPSYNRGYLVLGSKT
jgi:hypothetical protein